MSESTKQTVTINDEVFEINPMRAAQIAKFANILGRLTINGRKALRQAGGEPNDFIWAILAAVDETALVDMAALLVGCPTKFAQEHFSLAWVVEAFMIQIEISDIGTTIRNFSRLSSMTL